MPKSKTRKKQLPSKFGRTHYALIRTVQVDPDNHDREVNEGYCLIYHKEEETYQKAKAGKNGYTLHYPYGNPRTYKITILCDNKSLSVLNTMLDLVQPPEHGYEEDWDFPENTGSPFNTI